VGKSQILPNAKQQDLLGKGHLNVGFSVGQGYKGSSSTTTYYGPRIQYFLADGWALALEGRYLKSNSYYPFTYLGAGLSTRYYFLRSNRFAVFAQLGAMYGQSNYDKYDPVDPFRSMDGVRNNNWQTNAGLGIHYRLGKRWSLEATAERSWLQSSYLTPAYNRWQASVGINYRLK
jgi:outer membrane scaffolding protein for murein synthesis (MipA/OmpV family)